jgi:hypothetical protein
MQVYVPDAPGGTVVYSSCTYNRHLPVGISVRTAGVEAIVSLARREGREFVEIRLDVPEGKTVTLQDASVGIETANPVSSSRSAFPLVSLVDAPIVNNYSVVPGMQAQHLPTTAPLVGARIVIGSGYAVRHFWLATYVDTEAARDVWVSLPELTVNGARAALPRIHFLRDTQLAIAVFNC